MKIYCQKCGSGLEYVLNKPKFCSNCGFSFSAASSPIPKVIKNIPKITQNEDEEEIGTERVPDISKLDFDIDINSNKGTRLNNLMGTYNGQSMEETNSGAQRVSKQEAMEAFKREAGYYPSRQSMNEEE